MKKRFPIAIVLGSCLVLISFILLIIFSLQGYFGAKKAEAVLAEMEQILPDSYQGSAGTQNTYMPTLQINGEDYMAIVNVPSFGITLPVADKWNAKLDLPERFYGSAYNNTLVIGGADDASQFSFCKKIEHGATVIITDMTGAQFKYEVIAIARASSASADWLITEDADLTLFCHDLYTMEYIAVRCKRT